MSFDQSTLLLGVLFGAVGLGYFTYGRKQRAVVPLVVGLALFILPYLIANTIALFITGAVVAVIPYFIRV
jgi:ABC-type transport system involved in multi-copper enzyme maturation permease subunit